MLEELLIACHQNGTHPFRAENVDSAIWQLQCAGWPGGCRSQKTQDLHLKESCPRAHGL